MSIKHYFATALLMSAATGYSTAQVTDPALTDTASVTARSGSMATENMVSNETKTFMEKAATSGMMEVQLGKMAQEKASSSEVKDFGQMMVTDHSKANDKLKSLAQEKGVTLPNSLTSKQQQKVDKLSQLSSEEFDKEYMKMMVKDHKKDIDTYQKASDNVPDPAVQDFASQTLPTLKDHLQKAEGVNQQMRSS